MLKLVTTVGAPSYRVGTGPILGLTVTNAGTASCVADVSGSKQVFTVFDAKAKRVWSTADCFPGEGTDVRLLSPGESLQYNIKWSGTTSTPGCTGARVPVAAGTYSAVAALAGANAAPVKVVFTG